MTVTVHRRTLASHLHKPLDVRGHSDGLAWESKPEASASPYEGRMFHQRVKQPRGATLLGSQDQQ